MRFTNVLLTLVATTHGVAASGWFPGSKHRKFITTLLRPQAPNAISVYNEWHETELERWLSDHDIPYPTPVDRKDLEKLVGQSWDDYVVSPYKKWDTDELTAYLKAKGKKTQNDAVATRDSLISQVKANWYESEDTAYQGWANIKDWILDTWTESQLKAFCDKNGIPGNYCAFQAVDRD